jgi:hypothetical protein
MQQLPCWPRIWSHTYLSVCIPSCPVDKLANGDCNRRVNPFEDPNALPDALDRYLPHLTVQQNLERFLTDYTVEEKPDHGNKTVEKPDHCHNPIVPGGPTHSGKKNIHEELDRYLADDTVQGEIDQLDRYLPHLTVQQNLERFLTDYTVEGKAEHRHNTIVPRGLTHRGTKNIHEELDHYIADDTAQGAVDQLDRYLPHLTVQQNIERFLPKDTTEGKVDPLGRHLPNLTVQQHLECFPTSTDDTVNGKPGYYLKSSLPRGADRRLASSGLASIAEEEPEDCITHIVPVARKQRVVNKKVSFDTSGAEKELASRYKKPESLGEVVKAALKVYIPT